MPKSQKSRILFLVIFLISLFLRLALSTVNREANDSHEAVAVLILKTGSLPQKDDCWECFQPKLFHYIFAQAIRVLGLTNDPAYHQNIAGQAINFMAGIITLVVIWLFIKKLDIQDERIKLLAFGLVALNPPLIGISSQATNDAFAILFSTLALYFTCEFFKHQNISNFLLILLFVLLGISSKTNSWVTALAIGIALLLRAWVQKGRSIQKTFTAIIFILTTGAISLLNPLSQYIINYRQYGSPVLLNINPKPLPPFFGTASLGEEGIWYIQDGFFTFKFIDLLKHPRIENDPVDIQPTQTSFWTIIYGRAQSIYYDNSVPSWSTTDTTLFPLASGIFLLALLPTLMLVIGAIRETVLTIKSIFRRDVGLSQSIYYGLFALTFLGYVLFEILYALEYRRLVVIKAIFIYPALLSFPLLFIRTSEIVYASLTKWKHWLVYIFEAEIGALLLLYTADTTTLIIQLARIYLQKHGA